MKKAFVLMLVLMLSLSFLLTVRAESMPSLYEALLSLMNGRQFILTVNAVGTDELEPMLAPYGTVTCMLYQKGGRIILTAACEREARLDAIADSEGVQISTNLTEAGEYACEWDSLQPAVTLTKDELSVRLTFPNYEWINFSFKVKGPNPADCELEIKGSYMTGPGVIHSLWDGLTSHDGETSREFYLSIAEDEYAIVGEGTETIESAEDGSLVITREDECVVTHNDAEVGTLILGSTLEIR